MRWWKKILYLYLYLTQVGQLLVCFFYIPNHVLIPSLITAIYWFPGICLYSCIYIFFFFLIKMTCSDSIAYTRLLYRGNNI